MHQVFVDYQQAEQFIDMYREMRKTDIKTDKLGITNIDEHKIFESFNLAKKFVISEQKIIIWSKCNILHANLADIRESVVDEEYLWLKKSKFEIHTSFGKNEKRNKNLTRDSSSLEEE